MKHQTWTIKPVSQPIFLVGAERSGTTLLRLMLSQHPQIAWCAEFEYAVDRMTDAGDFPDLSAYYEWLETHRIFVDCGYYINRSLSYPDLVKNFLQQEGDRVKKPIVGATVHRHFDRLLKIWQQPKFIHIVRDPRDVACSCIRMGWAGNVWAGVQGWIGAEELWQHLAPQLQPDQKFEISYESLIAQPQAILSDLCQFMQIPYSEAMLKYPETTTYSAPDPNLIHQWTRHLSTHEIQLIESRVSERLVDRGYEPSHLPPLETTPLQLRLQLQDWLGRKQFRLQRYGLPLLVSDFLSRRLNIKGWQREIRLKLNDIERNYLK